MALSRLYCLGYLVSFQHFFISTGAMTLACHGSHLQLASRVLHFPNRAPKEILQCPRGFLFHNRSMGACNISIPRLVPWLCPYFFQHEPWTAIEREEEEEELRAVLGVGDGVYASLLRAIGGRRSLSEARRLHSHMVRNGQDRGNCYLANLTIEMYGRCGSLDDACTVFDGLGPHRRNRYSWNIMMVAYSRAGQDQCALLLFEEMQASAQKSDNVSFLAAISACSGLRVLKHGNRVHASVAASGVDEDIAVKNALLNMYSCCGSIENTRNFFASMCQQNIVSWTTIISAHAQAGLYKESHALFREMTCSLIEPDQIAFLSIINSCIDKTALELGKTMHACLLSTHFASHLAIENVLISMYGRCGGLSDAKAVFEKMQRRDVISWTAMIASYAHCGHGKKALQLFEQMIQEGIKPNQITYLTLLNSCPRQQSLQNGQALHDHFAGSGLEATIKIKTSLLHMYGKCGNLKDAQVVFNGIDQLDMTSRNAMIAVYIQHKHNKEAFELCNKMCLEDIEPDRFTLSCMLDAYAGLQSLETTILIHKYIDASIFQSDVAVNTALISMYGKCGSPNHAREVFDGMHQRDIITWNAMITAYTRNGQGSDALTLFSQLDLDGLKPDKVTLLSVLGACNDMASLGNGKAIHELIVANGFESDVTIKTALLTMYSRCGSINDAWLIFHSILQRDLISWTAIIVSCAENGQYQGSLELFRQMKMEGIEPNGITILCLLNACSHGGLLDQGWDILVSMNEDSDAICSLEHYVCIVDLLGRMGLCNEAEDIVINMPLQLDVVTWTTLLGSF